jgi:hypothetical protein
VSNSLIDDYLAGLDARAVPVARALDEAIRAAYPGFDIAVKYKILMYALKSDWRFWVCAISTSANSVGLRFLYGVILDDPLRVLRAGSSVLKTWDFDFDATVDPAAIGAYVTEAVAKNAAYKADSARLLEASRANAKPGRRATTSRGA